MGYHVRPSGRLRLPESDDAAAVQAVKAAWAQRRGQSSPDVYPGANLEEIAEGAAAAITRDGDWIEFDYDDAGDPKWSDLATAFYVALAPFVRSGTVDIEGEDGATWSYRYGGGQIVQEGWNGWDGSVEPFGPATEPVVTDS